MFTYKWVQNSLADGANTVRHKMPNFQFPRHVNWPWRYKILGAPQHSQKVIVNQSKHILVIASIKPFTCQSFRQNYFFLRN